MAAKPGVACPCRRLLLNPACGAGFQPARMDHRPYTTAPWPPVQAGSPHHNMRCLHPCLPGALRQPAGLRYKRGWRSGRPAPNGSLHDNRRRGPPSRDAGPANGGRSAAADDECRRVRPVCGGRPAACGARERADGDGQCAADHGAAVRAIPGGHAAPDCPRTAGGHRRPGHGLLAGGARPAVPVQHCAAARRLATGGPRAADGRPGHPPARPADCRARRNGRGRSTEW